MKKTAIIFDVDGTLWDSSKLVAESWNKAIKENSDLNISFTAEYLKANVFGKTMSEIGDILFPMLSLAERRSLSELCFKYEDEYIASHDAEVYEGVKETLSKLISEGYPLYIVSNCQKGYIELCIKQLGIEKYILDFMCFGDTGLHKGETIKLLMQRNNIKKAVYVGDTKGDKEASDRAGLPFIHVRYGFGSVPEALYAIDDIRELPKLLSEQGF